LRPDASASDLHPLRKALKKLRYGVEFFTSLYPQQAVKRLVKPLKKLQKNSRRDQRRRPCGPTCGKARRGPLGAGAGPCGALAEPPPGKRESEERPRQAVARVSEARFVLGVKAPRSDAPRAAVSLAPRSKDR